MNIPQSLCVLRRLFIYNKRIGINCVSSNVKQFHFITFQRYFPSRILTKSSILSTSIYSVDRYFSCALQTTCSPYLNYGESELLKIVRKCACYHLCCTYSSDRRRNSRFQHAIKRKDNFQKALKKRKDRLKLRGQVLLQDIRETRDKMKEKVEEVIERENIWTIPNLLCVTRIGLSPVLGYLIVNSEFNLAFALLAVAGVTDVLDGWIARSFKSQASNIGSFLDPAADKILIAILFLSLTYVDLIPVLLTGTIIVRDAILVGAGFYIRYQSIPPPRTLSRYFDATYATAKLSPTMLSKANTAIQLLMVATTLAAPVFNFVDHPALHVLWYLTATTTVASAFSYLYSSGTYKYLTKKH